MSYGVCACLDGGASNDGGDGGGTISIGTIPGLLAWFKGDKGIVDDLVHPGKVKRWLDQSGNGNDAQQRGGTEVGPTHDPAAVNGIDAVYFDSQTGLEMATSSSLTIGTDDFAVIFIAKIQPSTYATPVLTNNLLTIEIGAQPGSLGVNASGVTASVGWPSGPAKWRFFAARGKTLKLAIDDAVASTSATSTADLTTGGTLWSILPATTGNAATAEVAEFLMLKGAVSDADLAKIQATLKAKYNL